MNIANTLCPLLGDPAHHVLMDFGSGIGTALWTLCNALDTKGIGIEYSPDRFFLCILCDEAARKVLLTDYDVCAFENPFLL